MSKDFMSRALNNLNFWTEHTRFTPFSHVRHLLQPIRHTSRLQEVQLVRAPWVGEWAWEKTCDKVTIYWIYWQQSMYTSHTHACSIPWWLQWKLIDNYRVFPVKIQHVISCCNEMSSLTQTMSLDVLASQTITRRSAPHVTSHLGMFKSLVHRVFHLDSRSWKTKHQYRIAWISLQISWSLMVSRPHLNIGPLDFGAYDESSQHPHIPGPQLDFAPCTTFHH